MRAVVDHVEGHDVASQARAVAEFDGRCVESDQYVGIGGDQVSAHGEAASLGGASARNPRDPHGRRCHVIAHVGGEAVSVGWSTRIWG